MRTWGWGQLHAPVTHQIGRDTEEDLQSCQKVPQHTRVCRAGHHDRGCHRPKGPSVHHHCWMGYGLYILPSEDASGKGNTHVGREDSHKSIWCPLPRLRRAGVCTPLPSPGPWNQEEDCHQSSPGGTLWLPCARGFCAACWVTSSLLVVVQSFSRVWLFVTLWTAAGRLPCPSPSPGVCRNSCPTQPSHPLSSPSLTFNHSLHQGLFQWVGSSHQVDKKYWSFSFSINLSND